MTSPVPLRYPRRAPVALALTAFAAAGIVATSAFAPRPAAAAELPESLITTADTTWSYSEDGSDPADGLENRLEWATNGYDDSGWKSATGAFGAKHGEPTGVGGYEVDTLLSQYLPNGDDVPTFHFSTSIDIGAPQLADIRELRGEMVYDDAAQIIVNGQLVAGLNDGPVEDAPEAERNVMYAGSSAGDPQVGSFTVPVDALQEGENTIAVALYQDRPTSSDIYFDMRSLEPVSVDEPAELDDLVLTVGADPSQRGLTWYTNLDTEQVAQVVKTGELASGEFPDDAAEFVAEGAQTTSGEYNRKATITGLEESTAYSYRVGGDANGWTDPREFTTAGFDGGYEYLFFGDPQIGASGDYISDGEGWQDTLDVATETYPDSELLFSAGDQVNSAGSEAEYERFLAPEQMKQLPVVPVNGNHDVGSKAYEQHYSTPNLDPNAGAAGSPTASGGDYWFGYRNTLYVVINSNSRDTASHEAFMRKVVEEHGDEYTWNVLAFHHSIYSVAAHVDDGDIIERREQLPEVISDVGFDMVLMGHDHSYTRTYLIKDGDIANPSEQEAQAEVEAKQGEVLYVTANSASGSKYYDVRAPDAEYGSVINQEYVRNYSHVNVTDEEITVTTLRSEDSDNGAVNSVVDEVTLAREGDEDPGDGGPGDDDGDEDGNDGGGDSGNDGGDSGNEDGNEDGNDSGNDDGNEGGDESGNDDGGDSNAGDETPDAPGLDALDQLTRTLDIALSADDERITGTLGVAEAGNEHTWYVYSEPTLLGTTTADEDGSATFELPALDAGEHRLVALDGAGEVVAWNTFELGAEDAGELAVTGGSISIAALGTAGVLVALGAVLLIRRRREA